MQPFIVTLARERPSSKSLSEVVNTSRSAVQRFRQLLDQLVVQEGYKRDIGQVHATGNLPVLLITGTDRLADRIRHMNGVVSVARDAEVELG